MPLFSVIVPVYNAEVTIDRCIQSILEQSTDDFELILVDDGSADASLSICTKYSRKDSRIIVYSQQNGGVSSARNKGMELSSGNYLVFVDSDDYVAPDYLNSFKTNEQADLIIEGFVLEDTEKGPVKMVCYPAERIIISHDYQALSEPFIEGRFNTVWGKAFKRSALQNSNAAFCEGINMGEDTLFVIKMLRGADVIAFVEDAKYHYTEKTESSLTGSLTDMVLIDKLETAYAMIYEELSDMIGEAESRRAVSLRLGKIYKSLLNLYINQYDNKKNVIKHLYGKSWFRNSLDFTEELYSDENPKYRLILQTKSFRIYDKYIKYKMLKDEKR